jgi:hypothetical protein
MFVARLADFLCIDSCERRALKLQIKTHDVADQLLGVLGQSSKRPIRMSLLASTRSCRPSASRLANENKFRGGAVLAEKLLFLRRPAHHGPRVHAGVSDDHFPRRG